jgi:lactate dehydrogenase-like 2-hydroxyacid dehydrogenase
MTRPKVMVMSEVLPDALAVLEAKFDVLRCDLAADRDVFLRDNGKDCRAVIIKGSDAFGAREIAVMPKLVIVACMTAGFEAIDTNALRKAGIPLTNTSHALKDDVADTAVMLTLATTRELVRCDAYVRSGEWGQKGPYPLLSSLKGKRAGILGLGVIGQEIATRLRSMRLEIGYCTRSPKDTKFTYFPKAEDLAQWSDILIVVVPGGTETEHLVGHDVLTQLGPKGTLINVARGSVVDEAALIDCLSTGKLGAAGLDVYQNEPHPNSALTALENVVLNPHHASGTVETRNEMSLLAVENLIAHIQHTPLLTLVDGPRQTKKVTT